MIKEDNYFHVVLEIEVANSVIDCDEAEVLHYKETNTMQVVNSVVLVI